MLRMRAICTLILANISSITLENHQVSITLYHAKIYDVNIMETRGFYPYSQARQTRPNSGGVAEGHPIFDKGGVAIIFLLFTR